MRTATALGFLGLLVAAPACGTGGEDGVTLRVSAAASLTDAFTELAARFEQRHPDVDVELNFGPSPALVQQVLDGAPVDVLATADRRTMAAAREAGAVEEPHVVATNTLALAVEEGNPHGLGGVADLRRPGLVVVTCAPEVPCGRMAAALIRAAGGGIDVDSQEEDVKAVAARVAFGEADVGVVYATDVRPGDGRLDALDPGPAAAGIEARYPVATTTASAHAGEAGEWMDFLSSDEAADVLTGLGFGRP